MTGSLRPHRRARIGASLYLIARQLRREVADLDSDSLVLVGCSGGPDSLALAAAAGWLATADRTPRFGAIIVDHQLRLGSAQVAATAAAACRDLGLDPVEIATVNVSDPIGHGGLEAVARAARREALLAAANRHQAAALLLAHTLDDQAETVLLGLARGSGARSLAGMAARDGLWRRPLLRLHRAVTAAACAEEGLNPFSDPHNEDPRFARVRVRSAVLPLLEAQLGPGVAAALARSADMLRADADALDEWARQLLVDHGLSPAPAGGAVAAAGATPADTAGLALKADAADIAGTALLEVAVAALAELSTAVRTRVLRQLSLAAGTSAVDLTYDHIIRIDRLITDWRGQGAIRLPGGQEASRETGMLRWRAAATANPSEPGPGAGGEAGPNDLNGQPIRTKADSGHFQAR